MVLSVFLYVKPTTSPSKRKIQPREGPSTKKQLRKEARDVIVVLDPSPTLIDKANHSSSGVTTHELQDEVIQLPHYSTEELSSLLADKDNEIGYIIATFHNGVHRVKDSNQSTYQRHSTHNQLTNSQFWTCSLMRMETEIGQILWTWSLSRTCILWSHKYITRTCSDFHNNFRAGFGRTRMFRNNNWSTSAMVPSFFQGKPCTENFIDDMSNSEWTGNRSRSDVAKKIYSSAGIIHMLLICGESDRMIKKSIRLKTSWFPWSFVGLWKLLREF
ncbi:unnamed protein product [Allacma fusca]|uniref:Uncharacterized protein n=1 Tax=Allacma fusca TaxID=39272 RepID=A0A8J2LZ12_9HEXA|nr:unnamed protein product [Allacma fusca]